MSNEKEQEYFKCITTMRECISVEIRLWNISDIYKKVIPDEGTSNEFLCKCYIDTVNETTGIMKYILGHVRGDVFHRVFHRPKGFGDYHRDEYCEEGETDSFKGTVVRALVELDKARMRLAERMLELSNDVGLIDDFAEYAQGYHHALSEGHTLIELYKCLRHIHSGKYKLEILSDNIGEISKFDTLFCTNNQIFIEYTLNAYKGIRAGIDMFDPEITNHNKSNNWKPMTFVWAHTGEEITKR